MARRSKSGGISAIQAAIDGFRSQYESVKARIASIDQQLVEAEAHVAAITGGSNGFHRVGRPAKVGKAPKAARASGGAKRGRRPKGQDLASMIHKVLAEAKKPMGIPDVVSAVKRAGYASSSPSFPRIVGMRLSGDKKFKRAGRGVYTVAK